MQRTFPPIMTVLGVHCLLGSFLIPEEEISVLFSRVYVCVLVGLFVWGILFGRIYRS